MATMATTMLPDDLPIPDITHDIGLPRNELYFGWMRFTSTLDTTSREGDLLTASTFSTDIDGNLAYLSTTNFGVLGFYYAIQLGWGPTDVASGVAAQATETLQLKWRAAGGREDMYTPSIWPAFPDYRSEASSAGTGQLLSGPGGRYAVPQRFNTPLYVDDGGTFVTKVDSTLTITAGNDINVYVLGFAGSDQNWLGRYANCACTAPLPRVVGRPGRKPGAARAKRGMVQLKR